MDRAKGSNVVLPGILLAAVGGALGAQQPAPDEPSERFSVLVHTSVTEEEDPDGPYPMGKVTEEVAKRIQDRKRWFVLTDDPDRADILVDVVNHAYDERARTRLETRVDVTGTRKEWVDVSWVQEQHFLEARVDLPGGGQFLVEGSDTREKGGSLKRAAQELANDLERLCHDRYWELESERGRAR